MSLVEEIVELAYSGKLSDSLEKGYPPTSDMISDVMDAALQGAIPAYATAMEVAERAGEAAGISIDDVRHKIFREVSEASGLSKIIHGLVDAWHEIPESIRNGIRKAFAVGRAAVEFYNDPSWENFLQTAKAVGAVYYAAAKVLEQGATLVAQGVKAGAEWVYKYGSRAAEAVVAVLADIGETAVKTLVSAVYKEGTALATSGLSFATHDVKGLYAAAKSGDVVAVGKKLVGAVTDAPGDVVDAVSSGVEGVIESKYAPWNW